MNTKTIQTHKRDALLKNCMAKNLSSNTIAEISTIIGQVRREQGHEGAELKASEVNKIVESAQSEKEILKAIATMEKVSD